MRTFGRASEAQLKNSKAFNAYTGRRKVEATFAAAKSGDVETLRFFLFLSIFFQLSD